MKKQVSYLLIAVLAMAFLQDGYGQGPRPTGLVLDDAKYEELPHLPRYEGKKFHNVPPMVSLRQYCPVPGDQGMVTSCVGWACGYAAYTISKAVRLNVTDRDTLTEMAHSASYIFNQIQAPAPVPCTGGATFADAFWLMLNQGVATSTTFPNSGEDCSEMPDEKDNAEAANYKIKDFAAIFGLFDEPDVKVDKTIKSLAARNPVIIGMMVSTSFWDVQKGQKHWHPTSADQDLGGHAMVVVGYDLGSKTFELMNSYGPGWGDDGFIRVSFEDFGRYCKYGFQIAIEDQVVVEPEPAVAYIELEGDFTFNNYVGFEKDQEGKDIFKFEEAKTSFNAERGVYELSKQGWKVGDAFQLVARNIPTGNNVYVFSLNAQNKAELLFPVEEMYGMGRRKLSSALIPSIDAEVVIPALDEVMYLDASGEDYLCVLFSNKPIIDINDRVEKVQNAQGSFAEKLGAAFEGLLVDGKNIAFSPEKMSFSSKSEEGLGIAVPLVLAVTAN